MSCKRVEGCVTTCFFLKNKLSGKEESQVFKVFSFHINDSVVGQNITL